MTSESAISVYRSDRDASLTARTDAVGHSDRGGRRDARRASANKQVAKRSTALPGEIALASPEHRLSPPETDRAHTTPGPNNDVANHREAT